MTMPFLEAAWFPLWLFAFVIVGWWSWRFFSDDATGLNQAPVHWRILYQQALDERDETKVGIRIQKAEGAILLALATHVFRQDNKERIALREAMKTLHGLRQTPSEGSDKNRVSA